MIKETHGHMTAILYESINEPGSTRCKIESNQALAHNSLIAHDQGGKPHSDWLGADTLDEFETRLKFGWTEGADRLSTLATKEIEIKSMRRRRVKSDQGDELDMQAVWRGDMSRAWTLTRRESRFGPRSVSIVCNLSCNWTQSAKDLFWRGAAALKLAEALTNAGYNVAIYGATATKNIATKGDFQIVQFVEIKAEDSPLDVSALAAIVAMPGFKRTRFHAGQVAAVDAAGKTSCEGLGSPAPTLVAEGVKLLPMPQSAIIQPPLMSKEAAQVWIDEALEALEA